MLDFVCAVNGGVHSTSPLLDLTLLEENDVPNLTIAVLPKTEKVSLVTMETRLHVDRFEEIFRLATQAGLVVHREMKAAIFKRSQSLMASIEPGGQHRAEDADDGMNEI